jgi:hypothetical protein
MRRRGVPTLAAAWFTFALTANAITDPTMMNPAAPASNTTGGVIATDPAVIALVAEGTTRSSTFARIVADLQASDVLVTIEPNRRMKHGMTGYTAFVARTSVRRYLRVCFDPRQPRCEQIATIGHELWHAREIARHPEVVSQADFRALYDGGVAGRSIRGRWDSDGAVAAGRRIRNELAARGGQAP